MMINELIGKLDFKNNVDLFIRNVNENEIKYKIIFLSSLIDELFLIELINSLKGVIDIEEIYSQLVNIKVKKVDDVNQAIFLLYEGQVIVGVENLNYLILVDLRKIPNRGIQQPEEEKVVRGSKDGFSELLIFNIGLIRSRIKTPSLKTKILQIGDFTRTGISILYIENIVNKDKLHRIISGLNKIEVNSLIMTDRALEEILLRQNKTIFPLVRYTERPDVASTYLVQGHIIILVDNSSNAVILPISIFDHMKNVEEYRENYLIGNFTKIIRYFAIFLSFIFLPLSYLLSTNIEQINILNLTISNSSNLPIWSQLVIGLSVIELFRIAIIHTPNSISVSLSIVIGIILGEVALSLGIFMKDILIILSIFTISNYAIPSYELSFSSRIVSYVLLILSIIFNRVGFLIGLIVIFLHSVSIKVFDYPYLYPLIPFDGNRLKLKIFRKDYKKNKNN